MSAEDTTVASISGLLESLELLVAQAHAYERALPPDNYPARAAVVEIRRQAVPEGDQSDRPVHRARVEVWQAEAIGQSCGDRRFSCASRAVDRDDDSFLQSA